MYPTELRYDREHEWVRLETLEMAAEYYWKIVEVNDVLSDAPETVNEDPYGDGWMIKVKLADPSEVDTLMDADAYEAFISEDA